MITFLFLLAGQKCQLDNFGPVTHSQPTMPGSDDKPDGQFLTQPMKQNSVEQKQKVDSHSCRETLEKIYGSTLKYKMGSS